MKQAKPILLATLALLVYQLGFFCPESLQQESAIFILTSLVAGLGTAYLVVKQSNFSFLGLFVLIALTFFRSELFFYFDEWFVIERYRTHGDEIIWGLHNEHFIPGFKLVFLTQLKLFAENYYPYLFFSYFIHLANSFLLYKIFKKLGAANELALLMVTVFALSSLHAEVMSWAFEQSLLLSSFFMFSCLLFSIDYFETNNRTSLLGAFFAAAMPAFFFANGFIVILLVGVIALKYFTEGTRFSQVGRLLAVVLAGLLVPLVSYYLVGAFGVSITGEEYPLLYRSVRSIKYIGYGIFLGTIARGSGLYPGLEFGSARAIFSRLEEYATPEHPNFGNPAISSSNLSDPENWFLFLGIALVIVLSLYYLFKKEKQDKATLLFILGGLWMVAVFLLPAWGRSMFGVGQSQYLRYQYLALPGFLIMLMPLLAGLIKRPKFFAVLAFVYFSAHFYHGAKFDYFSVRGAQSRDYLEVLEQDFKAAPAPVDAIVIDLYKEQLIASWELLKTGLDPRALQLSPK